MLSKAYLEFMEGNGNITAVLFNLKLSGPVGNAKRLYLKRLAEMLLDQLQEIRIRINKAKNKGGK